jgi:hypothetical protein
VQAPIETQYGLRIRKNSKVVKALLEELIPASLVVLDAVAPPTWMPEALEYFSDVLVAPGTWIRLVR